MPFENGDSDVHGWVEHPNRYRYNRCDRCGKRRLFMRLYDVWPAKERIGAGFGWVCVDCLIEVISAKATAAYLASQTLRELEGDSQAC